MDELYAYTDRPHQEKSGMGNNLSRWNFAARQSDYVVLNLGTNDAYATLFGGDGEEAAFDRDYLAFLQEVRACNGPNTQIVCALGSMNYYLWHNIVRAVEAYRQQTDDANIHLYRFRLMHPMDGFGAAGHPSMATHERMAQEIANVIRSLENSSKG
jgi:lysophospholipase L1-like esterase